MPDYGHKVVFPNSTLFEKKGFGKVAHIPFIFDGNLRYVRFPNRFLIDRGVGYWDPKNRGATRNPLPPSRQSMKNYAYWLANALEWASLRGIDLMTCDYSEVLINRYQREMLKGIYSERNTPLAAETVNSRVQVALDFQLWAAQGTARAGPCSDRDAHLFGGLA